MILAPLGPREDVELAMMTTRESERRETIFAVASGPGRAGLAIIRVSGPRAELALEQLSHGPLPPARRATVRTLYGTTNDDRIDTALVVRFEAPHSYTGEDVVEFQVHGGRAVSSAILDRLGAIPFLRLAEPGEFTRRAVEAGKLDLTQAEAVADLVNAETEAQRRQAQRQLEGHLGTLYETWRARLIKAAAWVEAAIDFPDEEIPENALADSRAVAREVLEEITRHLNDGRRGEILRDGFHVAVIGPPNAGKSALVNALARRDVAIVSETPGTTRDVLEVRLDLKGYPLILADTAGLRESEDAIEREGVRRARARADQADARLLVLDGTAEEPRPRPPADIIVWNKADLGGPRRHEGLSVSALTGEGMPALIDRLTELASGLSGEAPVLTRARHRTALEAAAAGLKDSLAAPPAAHELTAEHLRRALAALGRITGRVDLDEVLDVVFRDFCIGK
jgi:tRNA modification GTPase